MRKKRPGKGKRDTVARNVVALIDTVGFIKDRMATKDDLADLKKDLERRMTDGFDTLHHEIVSKTGSISRRLDEELDKRKLLEVRVTRLEQKSTH